MKFRRAEKRWKTENKAKKSDCLVVIYYRQVFTLEELNKLAIHSNYVGLLLFVSS